MESTFSRSDRPRLHDSKDLNNSIRLTPNTYLGGLKQLSQDEDLRCRVIHVHLTSAANQQYNNPAAFESEEKAVDELKEYFVRIENASELSCDFSSSVDSFEVFRIIVRAWVQARRPLTSLKLAKVPATARHDLLFSSLKDVECSTQNLKEFEVSVAAEEQATDIELKRNTLRAFEGVFRITPKLKNIVLDLACLDDHLEPWEETPQDHLDLGLIQSNIVEQIYLHGIVCAASSLRDLLGRNSQKLSRIVFSSVHLSDADYTWVDMIRFMRDLGTPRLGMDLLFQNMSDETGSWTVEDYNGLAVEGSLRHRVFLFMTRQSDVFPLDGGPEHWRSQSDASMTFRNL